LDSGSIERPFWYDSIALWYSLIRNSISPFFAHALTYLSSSSRAFSHARFAPAKSPTCAARTGGQRGASDDNADETRDGDGA
jgi:hypothetical protein